MKKVLLACLLFFLGGVFSANAAAQEKTDSETSHWSVGIKAGLNYYRVSPGVDGSVTGYLNRLISAIGWTAPVFTAEYTFNPLFGLGVDGGYYTFNRGGAEGNTVDFTGYGSINMTNLLLRERAGFWTKVNFYTNFGIGLNRSFYKIAATNRSGNGLSLVVPTTFLLEYNLTDKLAVGAEAQYRYYLNESIGGRPVQGIGTDAFLASASLRYKFGSSSKTHVRNMSLAEFYPAPVPVIVEKVVEKAAIGQNELNRIQKLEARVDCLKDAVEKTSKQCKESKAKEAAMNAIAEKVKFRFNSSVLDADSHVILDRLVQMLKDTPSMKIRVSGHTDNVGTARFNKKLSLQRANSVKAYLVSKGIPSENIRTVGFGFSKPIDTNDTSEGRALNRRVEFEILK